MPTPVRSALSAPAVAAIEDLELAARMVVEGLRAGGHRSPFHGFSAEFQQHRPYRAGDDLKHLDWKLLARTERLYTRQFRETTNMSVMIVPDTSASMGFPGGEFSQAGSSAEGSSGRERSRERKAGQERAGQERPGQEHAGRGRTGRGDAEAGISKLHYATILAASLSYLVVTQGDSAGILTTSSTRGTTSGRTSARSARAANTARAARTSPDPPGRPDPRPTLDYLPARGGRAHLRSLIARIDGLRAEGAWEPERAISRAAELLRRRGVIVVISDFYDDEAATLAALRRVRQRGHDVVMLQLISEQERTFPYTGETEFEDLESGARRTVDARAAGEAYRREYEAFLARCRTSALRSGVDYALVSTADPPARALRRFLLARRARGVGGADAS